MHTTSQAAAFPKAGKRLTNRLELLFRTVLALPKASSSGLDCRMMSLTCCHSKQTRGQEGAHTYHIEQCQTPPKDPGSGCRRGRPQVHMSPQVQKDLFFPLDRLQPVSGFVSSNSLDSVRSPGARDPAVSQDLQTLLAWASTPAVLYPAALGCQDSRRKESGAGRGISSLL